MSLDKAILFFISVLHLASGVMRSPNKYVKVPTCFILSHLQRMLHTGISDCFEMTMHSSLFCIQLKSFVFTFDCDCYKDISKCFF